MNYELCTLDITLSMKVWCKFSIAHDPVSRDVVDKVGRRQTNRYYVQIISSKN